MDGRRLAVGVEIYIFVVVALVRSKLSEAGEAAKKITSRDDQVRQRGFR